MRIISLTAIPFLSGCAMFDRDERLTKSIRIDATTKIEVYDVGYGATTEDFTEIRKVKGDSSMLITRIKGSYLNDKVEISRINDTLFSIKFTDTSVFVRMSKTVKFTIKKGNQGNP